MQTKISEKRGKTIKLRAATIERLDKLRHPGQSYDGVVTELIDRFKEKKYLNR